MKTKSGLRNQYGQSVSLKSVHLEGRLQGLLLNMRVKQRYLNDSAGTIEATYTFPAGWGAQLMGFSVALNGKHMQAVALPKKKAEKRYEKAIERGDTPVMLEKSALGLYTANLGNLLAGESAEVTIEYAQLLRFEQGRVRITVPTVIGARYGDAQQAGHIAAHQTVDTDLWAEYPFTASLDILGPMAEGVIDCPSHAFELKKVEGGRRVHLAKGGVLDRDFVVTLEAIQGESFFAAKEDGPAYAAVASFCPKLQDQAPAPLALKILVDCSGSMEGDSIEQAQEAMHELILRLNERDRVSYSKFGTHVIHTANQIHWCTPNYITNRLAKAVHETAADLGGTELNQALASTFKISCPEARPSGCDVLLITDGDVWDIEAIVQLAEKSHHRIFAIGVGSAPAESLLRDLAEQTGGACELVTPTESIAEAVLRMTDRMRAAPTRSLEIQWPGEVLWQSKLPKQVFSEETIHVFARLKHKPLAAPTLRWVVEKAPQTASAATMEWPSSGTLPRLVAGAELSTLGDASAAEALALQYQLASKYTHLLLVHLRDEEDKAEGLPRLERIKQMTAAGWGGLGSTHPASAVSLNNVPKLWRSIKSAAPASAQGSAAWAMADLEIPAFLRKSVEPIDPPVSDAALFSPQQMLETLNAMALSTTKFADISQALTDCVVDQPVWAVLFEGGVPKLEMMGPYWACLLAWLASQLVGVNPMTRHAQRLLKHELSAMDPEWVRDLQERLAAAFPGVSAGSWGQVAQTEKLG